MFRSLVMPVSELNHEKEVKIYRKINTVRNHLLFIIEMLFVQNLPSYFIPSDVIAVDTPVVKKQTMKISIPFIFTNYLFKMGL